MDQHRRSFIKTATLATTVGVLEPGALLKYGNAGKVRVVVWDERQPRQKEAYENFLGNQIAGYLGKQKNLEVVSTGLDEPEQGLAGDTLDRCDVLIWWGHARQREVLPETGRKIVERIVAGSLSLITLHSAHWSTPFVEAMNELTRRRIASLKKPAGTERQVSFEETPTPFKAPKYDARVTPYTIIRKFGDREEWKVFLPNCAFPAYRNDGKPSTVEVKIPGHPIVKGIPAQFEISRTEMYDEPFHVPEPDQVIFEERWGPGEWFRSGMLWNLGRGKVFYFRPGHETYPVFKEELPLKILSNAVQWLGR